MSCAAGEKCEFAARRACSAGVDRTYNQAGAAGARGRAGALRPVLGCAPCHADRPRSAIAGCSKRRCRSSRS